ncbi:MAG: Fur family transcriptional regulator [Candidatus Marinimicrobia bacterium]|nr:Fur family transcriptional regulator [Candidatus Neomarinimicrobiota bacterium]
MNKKNTHELYIDFLRTEGMNITPERLNILDEVLKQKGHFKIDDIIRKMGRAEKRISRATVYRSIKTIDDAGLIKYIRSINDEKIYEVVKGHHDHMICKICGNIIEFHDRDLETLQDAVCRSYDFTPTRHTMKIFGICAKCKESDE